MVIDNITTKKNTLVNEITKRIYYAETDAGGIVYYGNLCNYIEMGCAEWIRKFVKPLKEITSKYNLFFVMKEVNLTYKKPVTYDNEITIRTWIKKIKYFSVKFSTEILVNGEVCFSGENKMIPIDINTKKPVKIPEEILSLFDEI
ncbi:acyl-CoA thioesterase [Clostridium sp. CF011]|uniref:acyl-CoA thioesterase n=1 Tax=Clostridium sp. CF011 TaxID=2843318 RepID=UPI001C0E5E11|nr:thioesterase family protein [Clostridium sp. CF011]MBU3093579.1 acyl-CoA thioesterase [Clostridium sp. CF011]WAG71698.1 acyl-CoA thioesterase [Clostridium sp. CF011]